MSTCSVLNNISGEPEIFYKSDNGNIFNNLHDVLNDSVNSYETGIKNSFFDFESILSTPIYDNNSIEGRIQKFIKQGYFTGEQINDYYESIDSFAADLLEADLLEDNMFGYERRGNSFKISDFEIKVDKSPFPIISNAASNFLKKLFGNRKNEIIYTKDQLNIMIENSLKKLGFSITGIENYKRRNKNIDSRAQALVDFSSKIVALKNGDIDASELSEEFCHIVIEGMNQEEIEKILPYINNTKEYLENSNKYREVYSKEIQDPELLEKAVRKEVLGKMLSNALMKNFSTQNRSETEINIFDKIIKLFKDILDLLFNNISNNVEKEIDKLSKEVLKHIQNDTIENMVGESDPIVNIMYSLSQYDIEKLNDIEKLMHVKGYLNDNMKAIDTVLTSIYHTLYASNKEIKNFGFSRNPSLYVNVVAMLNIRPIINKLNISIQKNSTGLPSKLENEYKTELLKKVNHIQNLLNELEGLYEDRKTEASKNVVKEGLMEFANKTEEEADEMVNDAELGIRNVISDINLVASQIAHNAKHSLLNSQVFSKLLEQLGLKIKTSTNKDINKYLGELTKISRKKLMNYYNHLEGRFLSGLNHYLYNKDIKNFELNLLKKYKLLSEEVSLEDYIKGFDKNGKKIQVDKNNDDYYRYILDYRRQSINSKFFSKSLKDRNKKFIQMVDKVFEDLDDQQITDNSFFKYLLQKENISDKDIHSSVFEKESYSPFSKGKELRFGIEAMTYREAKKLVSLKKSHKQYFFSTNPLHNLFKNDNLQDNDIVFYYNEKVGNSAAELSFYANKYKKVQRELMLENSKEEIKENFKTRFNDFYNTIKSEPYDVRNLKIKEWIEENGISFEIETDNTDRSGINFKEFFEKFGTKSVWLGDNVSGKKGMKDLESKYGLLSLAKREILKKYKLKNDYREVDAQSMSSEDKQEIFNIEEEMSQLLYEIRQLFDANDIELYKDDFNSEVKFNLSFHEDFKNQTGKSFEESTAEDVLNFLGNSHNMSDFKLTKLKTLIRQLKQNKLSNGLGKKYIDILKNKKIEYQNEDGSYKIDVFVKEFTQNNIPSWYRRYDSISEYDDFIRAYNNGSIDYYELITGYINNPTGGIKFNGRLIENMNISPSYRFLFDVKKNKNELADQFLSIENDSKEKMLYKYQLLKEMADFDEVSEEYHNSEMDAILKNEQDLKEYMMLMDAHIYSLRNEDMVKPSFIFRPKHKRKTGLEKIGDLIKDDNKVKQLKEYLKESINYTLDEYEDAYKSARIPKYGYFDLSDEERSSDILDILSWSIYTSNQFKYRSESVQKALKLIESLSDIQFKNGKKYTDTNYYKMMKDLLDINYFGKQTTTRIEFKVPLLGKTVDLSKVLMSLKSIGISSSLGLSPIVSATNFLSGKTQELILTLAGKDIDRKTNLRVKSVLNTELISSIKDVGNLIPEQRLNKILYNFGVLDMEKRFENTQFNSAIRMLPNVSFGPMSITNYPLQATAALNKLMEYRLVNGRFMSKRQYLISEKSKNPDMKESEIYSNFESLSKKSMYDFLDSEGNLNKEELLENGYEGDIEKDMLLVSGAINTLSEKLTMEIADYNQNRGFNNPVISFFMSLKKWLVMASGTMLSKKHFDINSGAKDEGLIYAPEAFKKLFLDVIKEKQELSDAWNNLSETEKTNIMTTMSITGVLTFLYGMTVLLKGWSDDEEEKDNYMAQLSAYLAIRSLNEAFSGNVGIGQSYYEAIQNPLMVTSTIKNLTGIVNFKDIGEETQSGRYKGMDKYVVDLLKMTSFRNLHTVSSADVLRETRSSYQHFNQKEAIYHIFNLLPDDK